MRMNRRIARGEGSYLYDTAGRRYLDGSAGAAAFSIGHDNPEVNAAIASQLAPVGNAVDVVAFGDDVGLAARTIGKGHRIGKTRT